MAEKTSSSSASRTPPTRTSAPAPVVKRRPPAAGTPRQAASHLASSDPQLLQFQGAAGNFAMSQFVAGAMGQAGSPASPPVVELASSPPDAAVGLMDRDALGFAPTDTLPMTAPALLAPPAPPYRALATELAPNPMPPGALVPVDSAPATTDGQVVDRPPTSPTARLQALQTAQERAERATQSDEPEFAQSVAVMPGAELRIALPASPPAETAQTDEQQATLQASEEAAEQLDEAAQDLTDVEPPVEEAAPAEGTVPAGGAASLPKSADLGAAAGQALNVLATPLTDVSMLTATRVQFAPRPEERMPQTPQAGFQAARRRAASETLASQFLTRNAAQAQNLLILGLTAPPRIFAAAVQAKSAIDAAVAHNIGAVQAQMAAICSQIITEAEAAIAGINTQREQAWAAITGATALAKTTIDITYTATSALLNTQESTQLTKLGELYTTWEPRLRAVGTEVGNEAMAAAQKRADQWLSQRNGESSILDGPIHDNRLEARANAAKQVAKAYKESLEKAANEQTDKVLEGKPAVLDAVRQATEQARANLETHHQTMLEALAQSEAGALAQMEEAAASLTQAVEAGRESYLASLAGQEAVQTSRLFEYGERQKGAIDADASLAVLALASGVGDAVTAFNTGLEDFVATAQATAAPDAEALQASLAEMQPQADMLLSTLLQQLADGIQASEAGIVDGGVQSVEGVNALGQSAIEQATSTGSGHAQSVAALLEQATAGFAQLQKGHTNTVAEAMTSAVTGFTSTSSELTTAFTQLSENALKNFRDGQTQLRAGLRTQGLKDLNATIETEAQKAADAVKPRWKKIAKWVITVVVVVAVVAISIATAGAGGVLGGILIGAALGGVAGATIQVGHNLVDGKEWSDGVGKAFVVGAIGGAFGGAGAALGKAVFGEVAKGVLNTGLKFGLEAGLDVIGGVVGDLAVGNPITLEGVLFGAAIGAGVSGGLAIGSALKGKIKIKPKVEIGAPRVEVPEVTAPTPKAVASEVVVPPAPKAAMPQVAGPAPRTAAPEAGPTPRAPMPEVTPPAPKPTVPEAAPPPRTGTPEAGPAPRPATPEGETPMPKTGMPEAEPAPTGKARPEEAEIEADIVAKQKTADGHEVKLLEDGRVVRCSDPCVLARNNRTYTQKRHTRQGNEVQRDLKKGREAHIFDDDIDLDALERKVWTEGQYHGVVRGWERFTYTSPTPIGRRIQKGKPDVLLYVVEVKGQLKKGEWEYHLVPRSKPATPSTEGVAPGGTGGEAIPTPTTKPGGAAGESAAEAAEGALGAPVTGTARPSTTEAAEEALGTPVTSAVRPSTAEALTTPPGRGTVWDAIRAEGPLLQGTPIPRYFELSAGGSAFWVHPNATKHMAENVLGKSLHPMQANMWGQLLLDDFQRAIEKAVAQGIKYGQIVNIDRWELIFNQRPGDSLPVIMHALFR